MAASWFLYTFLAFSGFVVVLSTCPAGWTEFHQECFLFGSHKKTWNDAELDCRRHSSYLTTDDNQEKHDFFHKFLNIFHSWKLGHFWLGGDDQVIENQWRWLETGIGIGSTTFWGQGQPDGNSSANCMSFYMNADNDLVWRDDHCTGHFNYICEKPATGNTSSPVIG